MEKAEKWNGRAEGSCGFCSTSLKFMLIMKLRIIWYVSCKKKKKSFIYCWIHLYILFFGTQRKTEKKLKPSWSLLTLPTSSGCWKSIIAVLRILLAASMLTLQFLFLFTIGLSLWIFLGAVGCMFLATCLGPFYFIRWPPV